MASAELDEMSGLWQDELDRALWAKATRLAGGNPEKALSLVRNWAIDGNEPTWAELEAERPQCRSRKAPASIIPLRR